MPKADRRVDDLIAATGPLLEFFSTADAVFDEDDAMSPEKRQTGMGRIYEAWKKTRKTMDPDFDVAREERKVSALEKEHKVEASVKKWKPHYTKGAVAGHGPSPKTPPPPKPKPPKASKGRKKKKGKK